MEVCEIPDGAVGKGRPRRPRLPEAPAAAQRLHAGERLLLRVRRLRGEPRRVVVERYLRSAFAELGGSLMHGAVTNGGIFSSNPPTRST